MNPFIASLIRTIVPVVAGSVLGLLARIGLDIDAEGQLALATLVDSFCIGAYYFVIRLVEQKVPQVGWLLGLAKSPDSYSHDTIPGEVVEEHSPQHRA